MTFEDFELTLFLTIFLFFSTEHGHNGRCQAKVSGLLDFESVCIEFGLIFIHFVTAMGFFWIADPVALPRCPL